jgi:hypothetical protein
MPQKTTKVRRTQPMKPTLKTRARNVRRAFERAARTAGKVSRTVGDTAKNAVETVKHSRGAQVAVGVGAAGLIAGFTALAVRRAMRHG